MRDQTQSELGHAFDEWGDTADAYAVAIQAFMRREPGAADELLRLSRQLEQCATEFRQTHG